MTISADMPIELVGDSSAMATLRHQLLLAARTNDAVLLMGERGLALDLIARQIHVLGPLRDGPFVTFNGTALPSIVAMSEMFGHLAGAFSGAYRDRSGVVWKANGGTLLIHGAQDSMNGPLRRLNESGSVYPLGATTSPGSVRVRMIVVTGDSGSIRRGHHRDSLHDWCPLQLRVPPLRERGQDALLLLQYFVRQASIKHSSHCPPLTPEAEHEVLTYPWPGNLDEIQRVAAGLGLPRRRMITVHDLKPHLRSA